MSVCSRWAGAAGAEKGEGKEGGPPPGVDGRGCGGGGGTQEQPREREI